jgi:hypothetical protein
VRDVIDIRDAIETFVPLAKRLGWLTRRLTGLVSSTLGSIALSMIVGSEQKEPVGIAVTASSREGKNPSLVFRELDMRPIC